MKKIKLLLISEAVGGGVRKHVIQLIDNLDQDKFDIYFIHGTREKDEAFVESYERLKTKATVIKCDLFVREINLKKDAQTLAFLMKKIKEIKPDIVHCHSSKAGAVGRVAAKICGVKKIFYTPHAYAFLAPEFSDTKKRIFIIIEILLSRYFTTKTFCVSKSELEAGINSKIISNKNAIVIHNGLARIDFTDKDRIRQELGFNSDDLLIGNNARLTEQKNPQLFIEIAKYLVSKNPNYQFVWIGDGPLKNEIKDLIFYNGLQKNVHLLGEKSQTDVLVSCYDVYLLTSLYEGLPYGPIEALRAGVPIISTRVAGMDEIVYEMETGFYVNDKIEQIFCKAIRLDKSKIKDCFNENFSLEKMIEQISYMYE